MTLFGVWIGFLLFFSSSLEAPTISETSKNSVHGRGENCQSRDILPVKGPGLHVTLIKLLGVSCTTRCRWQCQCFEVLPYNISFPNFLQPFCLALILNVSDNKWNDLRKWSFGHCWLHLWHCSSLEKSRRGLCIKTWTAPFVKRRSPPDVSTKKTTSEHQILTTPSWRWNKDVWGRR